MRSPPAAAALVRRFHKKMLRQPALDVLLGGRVFHPIPRAGHTPCRYDGALPLGANYRDPRYLRYPRGSFIAVK